MYAGATHEPGYSFISGNYTRKITRRLFFYGIICWQAALGGISIQRVSLPKLLQYFFIDLDIIVQLQRPGGYLHLFIKCGHI